MGYNLDFLDNDNELRSYFLGLYMADGWMEKGGSFFMSSIDKQIINDLVARLNYTNSITKCKNGGYSAHTDSINYRIGFHKKCIKLKMKELGFTKNKTGHEFMPDCVSDKTFHHFLRGFSDGDGHFSVVSPKGRKNIMEWGLTCASEDFLQLLLDKMRNESICSYNGVSVRKRRGVHAYRISFSQYDSVMLGDFIYRDASIYLVRKYEKYLIGKAIKCDKNPRWTKREIDMAILGIVPKNRTELARYALVKRLYG